MTFRDTLDLALRNLGEAKLRTSLTTLGVSIGIASLAGMVSLGVGLQDQFVSRFTKSGLFDTISVTPGQDLPGGLARIALAGRGGFGARRRAAQRAARASPEAEPLRSDLNDDTIKELASMQNVREVYPSIRVPVEAKFGDESEGTLAAGVPMSAKDQGSFQSIAYGRFLSSETAAECLLSLDMAKRIDDANPQSLIGKDLLLAHAVMRRLPSAIILLSVLAATVVIAQQPPVFTPNGALPVLDNYLEAFRKQVGIPGLSAAVVRDGVIIWEKGYGYQNTASRIPAAPDTPYLVGDLSGTLAAVLLLECSERRQLYLDDPIRKYGGELPEASVTIAQILSHTTPGLEEPFLYSPERYEQLTPVVEHCGEARSYRRSVALLLDSAAMQDSVPGTDLWHSDKVLREGEFESETIDRYRRVLDRMLGAGGIGSARAECRPDVASAHWRGFFWRCRRPDAAIGRQLR